VVGSSDRWGRYQNSRQGAGRTCAPPSIQVSDFAHVHVAADSEDAPTFQGGADAGLETDAAGGSAWALDLARRGLYVSRRVVEGLRSQPSTIPLAEDHQPQIVVAPDKAGPHRPLMPPLPAGLALSPKPVAEIAVVTRASRRER